MTLRLRAGAATDVGRVRTINQDSFLVLDDRGLYAVADGMGGHQGGEVASSWPSRRSRPPTSSGTADALAEAIEEANLRIHEQGEADPDLQGMGTTVVAVAVVPDDDGDETTRIAAHRQRRRQPRLPLPRRRPHAAHRGPQHGGRPRAGGPDHRGRGRGPPAAQHRHPGARRLRPGRHRPLAGRRRAGRPLLLCSDGLFNEVAADQIASVLRRLERPAGGRRRARPAGQRGRRPRQHHRPRRRRRGRRRRGRGGLQRAGRRGQRPDLRRPRPRRVRHRLRRATPDRRRAADGDDAGRRAAPSACRCASGSSWRVVGFVAAGRRGHRRRLRHDPVVRHRAPTTWASTATRS